MKKLLETMEAWGKSSILEELEDASSVDLSSFKINDSLEQNVWTEQKTLNPEVRHQLLSIAAQFWKSMDLPTIPIEDLTFTGSLANYNWSPYSDVDLHILVDYNDLPGNEEVLQALMNTKRSAWNNKHNIEIYGYEVEMYIQDSNEVHHSTGVYSVLNDQWLVEPVKKDFKIDYDNVKLKAQHIMAQINKVEQLYDSGDYKSAIQDVDRLKDKIRKFRKCGLEQGGEYSPENIAFKALRRNGYLKKLFDLKTLAYDKKMSLTV